MNDNNTPIDSAPIESVQTTVPVPAEEVIKRKPGRPRKTPKLDGEVPEKRPTTKSATPTSAAQTAGDTGTKANLAKPSGLMKRSRNKNQGVPASASAMQTPVDATNGPVAENDSGHMPTETEPAAGAEEPTDAIANIDLKVRKHFMCKTLERQVNLEQCIGCLLRTNCKLKHEQLSMRGISENDLWLNYQHRVFISVPEPIAKTVAIELVELLPGSNFRLDKGDLKSLGASILRYNGVITPLDVMETKDGKFRVLSGQRRHAAARWAGLKNLAVRVMPIRGLATEQAAIEDNVERKAFSPAEKALAMGRLSEIWKELHPENEQAKEDDNGDAGIKKGNSNKSGRDTKALAKLMQTSERDVERKRHLAKSLSPAAMGAWKEERINQQMAEELVALSPADQDRVLARVIDAKTFDERCAVIDEVLPRDSSTRKGKSAESTVQRSSKANSGGDDKPRAGEDGAGDNAEGNAAGGTEQMKATSGTKASNNTESGPTGKSDAAPLLRDLLQRAHASLNDLMKGVPATAASITEMLDFIVAIQETTADLTEWHRSSAS